MFRSTLVLLLCLVVSASAQSTPAVAKVPPLNVQVAVGTQQRAVKGSFYRKTMTISPKVTIDGTSRMAPIPALEATMVIITMDTRAKYAQNDESYRVLTTETIQVPAALNGDRRALAFAESSVTYDSYRDNSNVGGEVYKYYVFGLFDPQTKAMVDFKTNNPQLLTFSKANPEKREEFLRHQKGASFPATFK